jgi:hypothetical protein
LDERRDKTKPSTPERESWDLWRRRAQQLQTTFAQYRLPYLDVTGADLEEAVNVFVRVNQQGSAVKRAEVFAALTWDERGFDFAKEARDLLEDHPRYKNFGIEPGAALAAGGARREPVREQLGEGARDTPRSAARSDAGGARSVRDGA